MDSESDPEGYFKPEFFNTIGRLLPKMDANADHVGTEPVSKT